MLGAPNLIRGGSHSGNVAAAEVAAAGLLDVLSSDYLPASLLPARCCSASRRATSPPASPRLTAAPARAAGLADRGRLAPGLRADLLRFRLVDGLPRPTGVWSGGTRVA